MRETGYQPVSRGHPPMKQRLIDKALEMFAKSGYHMVGIDQVITAAKTTKTTFYNHFESKDDLILAVIQQRDAWWRKTFVEEIAQRAGPDPVARLRAVFDVLGEWFEMYDFQGCMFINAATEFPNPHDPAHQAAKANVDAIRSIVADLADEAGFDNPDRFAESFNLIVEGAIVTELIDRSKTAADTAAKLANILINSALASQADQ